MDNVQGPRGSTGALAKMNPKNNHWFGGPHCSLSMGPKGLATSVIVWWKNQSVGNEIAFVSLLRQDYKICS